MKSSAIGERGEHLLSCHPLCIPLPSHPARLPPSISSFAQSLFPSIDRPHLKANAYVHVRIDPRGSVGTAWQCGTALVWA